MFVMLTIKSVEHRVQIGPRIKVADIFAFAGLNYKHMRKIQPTNIT